MGCVCVCFLLSAELNIKVCVSGGGEGRKISARFKNNGAAERREKYFVVSKGLLLVWRVQGGAERGGALCVD